MKCIALAALAGAALANFQSGEIKTYETFTYGKFVVNMSAPPKQGTNTAFFLYWTGPGWSWAEWNEIDVEIVPSVAENPFSTNLIYGDGNAQLQTQEYNYSNTEDEFHEYTVEWTPDYISWHFDGKLVRSIDSSDEGVRLMTKAQNIMMNFWTPTWSPWGDNLDASDMPYYARYDYVEVWDYNADTKDFEFNWREDFNGPLDESRWLVSNNWGFGGNSTTFMSSQVYTEDGNLVLKMEDVNGYTQ